MQNCQNKYVWFLAAWFLILGCNQSATYAQSYGAPYAGSTPRHTATASINCDAPNYAFHSTSGLSATLGSSSLSSTVSEPFSTAPTGGICREGAYNPWDEEGDPNYDPLGVAQPVGDAVLPLLLLLLCYVAVKGVRLRRLE